MGFEEEDGLFQVPLSPVVNQPAFCSLRRCPTLLFSVRFLPDSSVLITATVVGYILLYCPALLLFTSFHLFSPSSVHSPFVRRHLILLPRFSRQLLPAFNLALQPDHPFYSEGVCNVPLTPAV